FLIVREPPRGGLDRVHGSPTAAPAKAGFLATFRMFFSRPILVLIAVGGGATQFITYGLGNFTVLFLQREKGMALNDVAIWYALVVGIAMSAGIFVSGRLIDRFTRKSKVAYAVLPAASLAFAVPFYVGFVWAETWPVALLFLIGPTFLNYFYLSSSVTLVQQEVKPNERVMSGALLLLIMNLTGLGFGPTYVGMMSDMFKATSPEHSLQMALYTLIPVYFLAIGCFVWLARMLRKEDRARA
ncbi:MAG: MFS transporter, partial [Alphaproteobacteria bacterium]